MPEGKFPLMFPWNFTEFGKRFARFEDIEDSLTFDTVEDGITFKDIKDTISFTEVNV